MLISVVSLMKLAMRQVDRTAAFKILQDKQAWIFDMDGVIYTGNDPISGAASFLNFLKTSGKQVFFLTNNSTRTRERYVSILKSFDIHVKTSNIFTSATITASRLRLHFYKEKINPSNVIIYVIGENGLKEALRGEGFTVLEEKAFQGNPSLYSRVNLVTVGLDRNLTYQKLDIGLKCMHGGAFFVASNDDPTLPSAGNTIAPGAGSIISALVTASGKEPELGSPFGKPNRMVFDDIISKSKHDISKMIMVGDRLETDILAAKNASITSLLVKTGIWQEGHAIPHKFQPDLVLESISAIHELLKHGPNFKD
ncbi:HAD-IIA family hydrolase [Candidatus Bathyarchaeota archaeon]|nr:HAD-IIA family hydrolase [Candidatus Bathyarchaeota archaeon]